PLGAERLPRQVLAAVPAARGAGKSLAGGVRGAPRCPFRPLAPRVAVHRVLAERLELRCQGCAAVPGERRRDPHVVELARVVEEAQEQRADVRTWSVLVPAEAG